MTDQEPYQELGVSPHEPPASPVRVTTSPREGVRRIASFLPAATEIAYALGLERELVAVSHECDYPADARTRPVVVHGAIDSATLSSGEIDAGVSELLHAGESLYRVDEASLRALAPELILTQDLCQVCAPSGNAVTEVLRALSPAPEIVWLTPRCLDDVLQNIRDVGAAAGCPERAASVVAALSARLARIAERVRNAPRPSVSFIEWVEPIYCAGHWVPDMIECAHGHDGLARAHADSVRADWADVRRWAPEVLIVGPCGFDLARAVHEARVLTSLPGWGDLPAVRAGRVYVVNANAYFARPGPRLIDGTELLAHLFHPSLVDWTGPSDAFAPLSAPQADEGG